MNLLLSFQDGNRNTACFWNSHIQISSSSPLRLFQIILFNTIHTYKIAYTEKCWGENCRHFNQYNAEGHCIFFKKKKHLQGMQVEQSCYGNANKGWVGPTCSVRILFYFFISNEWWSRANSTCDRWIFFTFLYEVVKTYFKISKILDHWKALQKALFHFYFI